VAAGYLAERHEFDRRRGFNTEGSCPNTSNQNEDDMLATLMLFLESLIKETPSPDVIALAAAATISRAKELGLDEGSSRATVERMLTYVRECQSKHPFSSMF